MARELELQVAVTGSEQGVQQLGNLERGITGVTTAAAKADPLIEQLGEHYTRAAAKARTMTDAELDAAIGTKAVGTEADKAAAAKGRQAGATDALSAAVRRYAGPAAVGMAILKTGDWADKILNLSRSTGIGVEALQKFEQIGKLSGISVEQFSRASIMLSDRLAGGDKSAVAAVKKLNLDLDRLVSLSPDETMLEFARALAQVENPQQRINIGTDAMGRGLANVLPMVLELGTKWDQVSAKLDEQGIKSLAAADDALDEMTSTGKGLLATVLVPFAPLIEGINTVLQPVSKLLSAFLKDVTSPLRLDSWRAWADTLRDAARSMQFMVGIGPGIQAPLPTDRKTHV